MDLGDSHQYHVNDLVSLVHSSRKGLERANDDDSGFANKKRLRK